MEIAWAAIDRRSEGLDPTGIASGVRLGKAPGEGDVATENAWQVLGSLLIVGEMLEMRYAESVNGCNVHRESRIALGQNSNHVCVGLAGVAAASELFRQHTACDS